MKQADSSRSFLSPITLTTTSSASGSDDKDSTGFDDLRTLAVARLYLDNFQHVKSHWIMVTPALSQMSLHFGVNDLEGTVVREKIYHAVGAHTPQALSLDDLVRLIQGAGKSAAERDSFYNVLRHFPSSSASEAA